jgi:hypothetical protein
LREVDALTGAGAEKQAYEQSIIDAPLKTAMNVQGLLRGYTVPQTELETYVGPGEQGQYQQSDLANILEFFRLLVRRLEMFLMFNRARLVQLSWVAPDWQRSTTKQRSFLRTPTYLEITTYLDMEMPIPKVGMTFTVIVSVKKHETEINQSM